MNYAEKTRTYEPYLAFMTRRHIHEGISICYYHLFFGGLKIEQGKKRRVFDVLKGLTKKQASTQIEIDPQAIVEAPAVFFPKHG